jgi:nucleoside-diphosphate-sugar epimerase
MKRSIFLFLVCSVLLHNSAYAQKTALICGAGGFIGSHLAKRLKKEGYWVRGVDLHYPEFSKTACDEFVIGDLRDPQICKRIVTLEEGNDSFDEVYQLAADMGGMGYISCHDAAIMHNSGLININMVEACRLSKAKKIFYSSSACVYPEHNQLDPQNPHCAESSAYPAAPDTEYGWEKLFSERLYRAYARDYGMNVRIARFHNIFGPEGTWTGGKEKAPAALCRKIAEAQDGDIIPVWGKGDQTRSFLYIDECLDGVRRLMDSDVEDVINIGSDEMVSINDFTTMIARISAKNIVVTNVRGPEGVRGRTSDNTFIKSKLGWAPSARLEEGMRKTYPWILEQVNEKKRKERLARCVTNPERVDGFGSQFQTIIQSVIYAELNNLEYVYTPFKTLEHNYDNDPDFLMKKEWLINFKDHFEVNANNEVAQLSHSDLGIFINFFENNLINAVNSQSLKKIKKIFRENKNVDKYFDKEHLNIVVHVRRPNPHDNRLYGADTPDDLFLGIINKLRTIYADRNPLFHVQSQGNVENFRAYNAPDTVLHLNESVEDSFTSMVLADVLVVGASGFSYTAGLLSEGVVYCLPFWHRPLPSWIPVNEILEHA